MKTTDIYSFRSYRLLLKHLVEEIRGQTPGLTFRALAKQCGVQSPTFLTEIADGKKNLSIKTAEKICFGLGLRGKEAKYFSLMVELEIVEAEKDRLRVENEIKKILKSEKNINIDSLIAEYYRDWRYLMLREWVSTHPGTYETFRKSFEGFFSSSELKAGLDLLVQIGMIQIDNDVYLSNGTHITTSADVDGNTIREYARVMIGLADKAISSVPWQFREISSLTLPFRVKDIEKAKERIRDFKESFDAEFDYDQSSDAIFQLNIQFYPIFKKKN